MSEHKLPTSGVVLRCAKCNASLAYKAELITDAFNIEPGRMNVVEVEPCNTCIQVKAYELDMMRSLQIPETLQRLPDRDITTELCRLWPS